MTAEEFDAEYPMELRCTECGQIHQPLSDYALEEYRGSYCELCRGWVTLFPSAKRLKYFTDMLKAHQDKQRALREVNPELDWHARYKYESLLLTKYDTRWYPGARNRDIEESNRCDQPYWQDDFHND